MTLAGSSEPAPISALLEEWAASLPPDIKLIIVHGLRHSKTELMAKSQYILELLEEAGA